MVRSKLPSGSPTEMWGNLFPVSSEQDCVYLGVCPEAPLLTGQEREEEPLGVAARSHLMSVYSKASSSWGKSPQLWKTSHLRQGSLPAYGTSLREPAALLHGPIALYGVGGGGELAEQWQKMNREVGQKWSLKPCALGIARLRCLHHNRKQFRFHISSSGHSSFLFHIESLMWKKGRKVR